MISQSLTSFVRRGLVVLGACAAFGVGSVFAQDTTTTCEEGFRLFDHEVLVTDPVCIPENPQRINYLIYASYLYPFGVTPVGAWGFERDAANFPVIADWISQEGIADLGLPPSLEALTATQPDLMIMADTRVTEIVDELPMIAPTLIYSEGANWRDRHLFLGAVFGQEAEAEAQLAVVDQRISELSAAFTAKYGDVTEQKASLVRIFEPGNYFLASERYTSVEILTQIGFQIAEEVQNIDAWGVSFGDEDIKLANADFTILIGSTGGANNQSVQGEEMVAELMANPLWNTLDAFQNEQVFAVGDYFQQSSLMAAHQIVDEYERIFDVEIETPNPFLSAVQAEATPEATEAAS
ncbi:MAG: ABC transporter substrate-binding protein [Chloroflexi bacterium]|nr:ABC transporter substrate-binding protein [Chloroflexota bacterium]MCC6896698.1 ABC transporter substrate-binding protein [Anaerolineae bacterium]